MDIIDLTFEFDIELIPEDEKMNIIANNKNNIFTLKCITAREKLVKQKSKKIYKTNRRYCDSKLFIQKCQDKNILRSDDIIDVYSQLPELYIIISLSSIKPIIKKYDTVTVEMLKHNVVSINIDKNTFISFFKKNGINNNIDIIFDSIDINNNKKITFSEFVQFFISSF